MRQTPAHSQHNPDLLKFIPSESRRLIEVGCSSGALAREYKKIFPEASYIGIEIDLDYAELARQYCDKCFAIDIESATEDFWNSVTDRDCWIFGDTLEHLRDPWKILGKIAKSMTKGGHVVACIPNMQHWSVQARLSVGDLRYQDNGLLDRTHLRWFTRQTMIEMFEAAGFKVVDGMPRIFEEPLREKYLPLIHNLARATGADPNQAINDALPLQYVIRATLI